VPSPSLCFSLGHGLELRQSQRGDEKQRGLKEGREAVGIEIRVFHPLPTLSFKCFNFWTGFFVAFGPTALFLVFGFIVVLGPRRKVFFLLFLGFGFDSSPLFWALSLDKTEN